MYRSYGELKRDVVFRFLQAFYEAPLVVVSDQYLTIFLPLVVTRDVPRKYQIFQSKIGISSCNLPLHNDRMRYLGPTFLHPMCFLVFLARHLPLGSLNHRRPNRGLNFPPAGEGLK